MTTQTPRPDILALFEPDAGRLLPDYSRLDAPAFREAFALAMAQHRSEIGAIRSNVEAPTFENTLAALERSGRRLDAVGRAFYALAGANTDEAIQALEGEIGPQLSRHHSAIQLDPELFARVDTVFDASDDLSGLSAEDRRLLERTHSGFVRSGARLAAPDRERLAVINAELSALGTRFAQNVLADEREWRMRLIEDDLAGLPEALAAALASSAEARGEVGYLLTLSRSIIVPFLTLSDRRDLRRLAFEAWTRRGENEGESDNRPIMAEILRLRAEKAHLLGYENYAAFKLADEMAGTPEAVRDLLNAVWEPAIRRVRSDAQALAVYGAELGPDEAIAPWDWRYLAEKRRRAEHAFEENALRPYLALERVRGAAFDVAGRLFGLAFEPLPDIRAWHPDVKAWRVRDQKGHELGLFLADDFARRSKRSGAWMSGLRGQHGLDGGQRPIVFNVCNFAKPPAGSPALLSLDDARTLFHEFGHALHGLMSDVRWPSLAGTAVSRDFVELPSQLYEHWFSEPEVLRKHALHVETGEPMPRELLDKLAEAAKAEAGFDTIEYIASAMVDLDLHTRPDHGEHPLETERETLRRLGMPEAIVMRHRSPHFAHIFSGDGYAAGYYSYMWSEVLDADAFEAFREAGGPFDAATADRLREHVYSAGNSRDAAELYTAFRGRMPTTEALLRKRGFADAA